MQELLACVLAIHAAKTFHHDAAKALLPNPPDLNMVTNENC